jgi:DtxR family Mn-dependent transcriptional regulator
MSNREGLMASDSVYGENTEMYLKTLVELSADREVVPVTGLAQRLGISTVSASEKVRRLQDQGFVEHLPYKGVSLTKAGLKRANAVLRRHRLWECFLVDHLGFEWQHAHDAACRLEHATNREISERLALFLGEPETCPHGNPIPNARSVAKTESGVRLSEIDDLVEFVVVRVFPESTALLEQVVSLGLFPGVSCKVISPDNGDESAIVSIEGNPILIQGEISSHIYIRALDEVIA